jgi:hypothetical protein
MTEEIEKVTTEKPKNPGRQEWGRKLGKMQKELKLKKQEKQEKEQEEEKAQSQPKSSFKWEYAVTILTIGIGILALYYRKKSYETSAPDQVIPVRQEKKSKFSDF